jgi:hypothetical protein
MVIRCQEILLNNLQSQISPNTDENTNLKVEDKLGVKGENATTKSEQIVNIIFGAIWIYHLIPSR